MKPAAPTTGMNPTTGASQIRVIRGHGRYLQQRWDDRAEFAEILIQLRILATRADGEMAEYYRRNLIQQADLMGT